MSQGAGMMMTDENDNMILQLCVRGLLGTYLPTYKLTRAMAGAALQTLSSFIH